MANVETLLIRPSSLDEIPSAVTQLCTDLQIGGIVVGSEIAQQLFYGNFEQLAKGIPTKNPRVKKISDTTTFDKDSSWHLARQSDDPELRFWQHQKGSIHFVISRSLPDYDNPGYYDETEITRLSYVAPVEFTPKQGEALIFVDKGHPTVTGTGSFHKTELRGAAWHNTRLSSATDISFTS